MKAMILAAGLGTRLRPWTLEHPKALVPVAGVPMLERVILSLRSQGFTRIVVNMHHFAEQIFDFLDKHDYGIDIKISDESAELLDTGGGILHAADLLCCDDAPFLVHNVDILSNADLCGLMTKHSEFNQQFGTTEHLGTLLTSNRDSSRKLVFKDSRLAGWHNISTGDYRPSNFTESYLCDGNVTEKAFSGIYVLSPSAIDSMLKKGFQGKFPIMDWLLHPEVMPSIRGVNVPELDLIDIGKPATLQEADRLMKD